MKTTVLFSTLILALSLSGAALACNGKNGECCDDVKKAPGTDVTGADAALAEQAARSMMDSDRPRPDGKLSPEMRAKLARDSQAITKSIKAGNVSNTCHDADDGAQCGSDGSKSCCGEKKAGASGGSKAQGSGPSVLDGRSVALRGKCPDHKH